MTWRGLALKVTARIDANVLVRRLIAGWSLFSFDLLKFQPLHILNRAHDVILSAHVLVAFGELSLSRSITPPY
jgi:hypothetical protein